METKVMTIKPATISNLPDMLALRDGTAPSVTDKAAVHGFDFRQSVLARMKAVNPGQASESRDDQAREAASQFVSTALVMPLLKQLRNSPFKSEYFHGGQGEDAFGPQLDQILADRITQRMSTPSSNPQAVSQAGSPVQGQTLSIVDAVYRQMMNRGQSASGRRINHHG